MSTGDEQPKVQRPLALVTGGTGGLGTAICQALARRGMRVMAGYFHGGDSSKADAWLDAQRKEGLDIGIAYGDVSKAEPARNMVLNIMETQGPISVLVNNAGITRDASLRKQTQEGWRAVLETNLFSIFNVTQPVLEGMISLNYGRIINISSINGEKGQFGQTNYAAAKAGMHGFTKSLALEVASKGITVNTVAPGYAETEMIAKLTPEMRSSILKEIPVGRFARPEEIARMVNFLADRDSGYITGAIFSVNGGHYMH